MRPTLLIEVRPRGLAAVLLVTALLLAFVGAFGPSLAGLERLPTIVRFYSATLLLSCSGLSWAGAAATAEREPKDMWYWRALALSFLVLAIMKDTAVDDDVADLLQTALGMSKLSLYAWAYGTVLLGSLVVYRGFITGLQVMTRRYLTIGSGLFAIGAFGVDLLSAMSGSALGHHTLAYLALTALEDAFEMTGEITMVYGLLLHLKAEVTAIQVRTPEDET